MNMRWLILLLSVGVVGCRGIPNSFQGEYENKEKGVWLDLGNFEAEMRLPDGRKIDAKLEEFKVDLLKEGKRAIYVRPNAHNEDMVEIYWLQPNLATRSEGGGLIWYEAEMIYSMINSKESNVATVTVGHCLRAMVLLDSATGQAQLGCPSGAEKWSLKKTKDSGGGWPENPGA